jgi:hypothetical protein
MTPQELVASAMLDRNPQANRLGIPQQMGAFANSLGMVPTPQQEALQEPLIAPETYGIGTMLKKAAPMLPGALGMTVFHGSPHKFDKFDMSKIGTGEGVQAFGHGLYFAENPGVAKDYAKRLGRKQPFIDALQEYYAPGKVLPNGDKVASLNNPTNLAAWTVTVQKPTGETITHSKTPAEVAKTVGKGNLYKVDLPDDSIAKMLDWDKPLSQQPEHIGKAIQPLLDEMKAAGRLDKNGPIRKAWENPTGQTLMTSLDYYLGGQANTSRKLKDLGITGIKYKDAGSRVAKEGTSNFVVFDDTLPKIVGKE